MLTKTKDRAKYSPAAVTVGYRYISDPKIIIIIIALTGEHEGQNKPKKPSEQHKNENGRRKKSRKKYATSLITPIFLSITSFIFISHSHLCQFLKKHNSPPVFLSSSYYTVSIHTSPYEQALPYTALYLPSFSFYSSHFFSYAKAINPRYLSNHAHSIPLLQQTM